MTVLILADDLDPSVDAMVRELKDREVRLCRVNTGWFPAQLSLSAELRGGVWSGHIRTPRHRVELEEITSVWFRSPTAFRFPDQWSRVERQHSHNEAKFGLGGVLTSIPASWINHPARVADAVYKPVQLVAAARAGMAVPDTLVTNEADSVRRFSVGADDGTVLAKTLGAPTIIEGGQRKVAFTRRVRDADLADLAGVELTAHQFQRWVPKAHDVRVIVVGNEHWAVSITSDSAAGHLDFRNDYDSLRYELVPEPVNIHDQINCYMARFDLFYGAFDFVADHDGRWWFLECNPGGQYGWLEQETGAPITAALAEALAKGTAR
jgi:ATP-grasp ribosomal peptide maturase